MKRYPVYRALYKPMFIAGVPLGLLVIEAALVGLFIAFGWYLAILVVILFHLISVLALKQDAFLLQIMMEVCSLRKGEE